MLIQDSELLGKVRIEVPGAPPQLPDVHVLGKPGEQHTKIARGDALVQNMSQPGRARFRADRRKGKEVRSLTAMPGCPLVSPGVAHALLPRGPLPAPVRQSLAALPGIRRGLVWVRLAITVPLPTPAGTLS